MLLSDMKQVIVSFEVKTYQFVAAFKHLVILVTYSLNGLITANFKNV